MAAMETTFDDYRPLLQEACLALGYLQSDLSDDVMRQLYCPFGESPASVARGFRKQARQMTDDERHALGFGRRAFMAINAASVLTDKGRSDPVHGLEITVRRAAFALTRLVHARLIVENAASMDQPPLTRLLGCTPYCDGAVPDVIFETPWLALAALPLQGCNCEACAVIPRLVMTEAD